MSFLPLSDVDVEPGQYTERSCCLAFPAALEPLLLLLAFDMEECLDMLVCDWLAQLEFVIQ